MRNEYYEFVRFNVIQIILYVIENPDRRYQVLAEG